MSLVEYFGLICQTFSQGYKEAFNFLVTPEAHENIIKPVGSEMEHYQRVWGSEWHTVRLKSHRKLVLCTFITRIFSIPFVSLVNAGYKFVLILMKKVPFQMIRYLATLSCSMTYKRKLKGTLPCSMIALHLGTNSRSNTADEGCQERKIFSNTESQGIGGWSKTPLWF